MGKAEKISLLLLILLWTLFGRSGHTRASVTLDNALQQCNKLQYLTEYHKAFNPSSNAEERVVLKLKIKTRYKGGETPFVMFALPFTATMVSFARRINALLFKERIYSVYSFNVALRGPPSVLFS